MVAFPTKRGMGGAGGHGYMYEQVPGGIVNISHESFRAIEEYILWAENVPRKMPFAMDTMVRFMALLNMGYAQEMSAGPKRDPRDSARAWQKPVPRITGKYYLGWRVQRLSIGTWILTNDSREAYFIEFGIHRNPQTGLVSSRRIRRPIFKLSLRKTLNSVWATAIAHRAFSDMFVPKPGQPGRRSSHLLWYSQSPSHALFSGVPLIHNGKAIGIFHAK